MARTPQEVAAVQFASAWPDPTPIGPDTLKQIDTEIARLSSNGAAHNAGVAALTVEYGEAGYAALIAEAKAAVQPGKWRPAIEGSRPVLRLLASRTRYLTARATAKLALPT